MPDEFGTALRWTERLIACSAAVSAFELLRVRRALRDDAVFRWPTLRREYLRGPPLLLKLLDAALAYRPFVRLQLLALTLALLLLVSAQAVAAPLLLAITLLTCLRFRGTYNGGSDAMTVAVLLGASIARTCALPLVQRAALGYVAAQLVLSYTIAGLSKLRDPSWRSGAAPAQLLALPSYGAPWWARRALSFPRAGLLAAWAVIAFECAFPLALLVERACLPLLVLGALFHLLNARVLGLNRFFWAWLSAYPSLLYFSQFARW